MKLDNTEVPGAAENPVVVVEHGEGAGSHLKGAIERECGKRPCVSYVVNGKVVGTEHQGAPKPELVLEIREIVCTHKLPVLMVSEDECVECSVEEFLEMTAAIVGEEGHKKDFFNSFLKFYWP